MKNKIRLHILKKNYRWIKIKSWKIKHEQNNSKIYIFKKSMQNIWLESWDRDKLIEKKMKIITKPILKTN